MGVLSAEDRAFFRDNGYLVVPNAVPQQNLDATVDTLWNFLGIDRDDPRDWYRPPMLTNGLVEIYQHQTLWDNRQHPRVHQAFAELLGTENLWVSIDRASLKPPRHPDHPEYEHKGFIHWDADSTKWRENPTKQERPRWVQGVLYLTDTAADQGGFQCVPELYRDFEGWLKTQPPDRNPSVPDLTGLTVEPVPGKAGDLVIWDVMLAHGNGHNVSNRPRLAQYIAMGPAPALGKAAEEQRQERIRCWREHCPPGSKAFPGDVRQIEQTQGRTAELTPLGRKLLGLDPW